MWCHDAQQVGKTLLKLRNLIGGFFGTLRQLHVGTVSAVADVADVPCDLVHLLTVPLLGSFLVSRDLSRDVLRIGNALSVDLAPVVV